MSEATMAVEAGGDRATSRPASSGASAASGPPLRTVLREQLALVGLAIRRETLIGAFLFVVPIVTVLLVALTGSAEIVVDGDAFMDLDPGEGVGAIAGIIGLLFPFLVWKGEERFGDTTLWTTPAGHRRQALAKVGAGWIWLMGIGVAVVAFLVAITVATGGALVSHEVVLLITDPAGAAAGEPGSTRAIVWTTAWWQWALPFTTASAAYLVSSALFMATERPWWWVVGAWFFMMGAALLGLELEVPLISTVFRHVFGALFWAVDGPVTGGFETLTRVVELPDGMRRYAWTALPSASVWAVATALWWALGLGGLWLAAGRRRGA